MEQSLIVKPEQAVETPLPRIDVSGSEQLGREDVAMPRVRVRQPTSQFGAPVDAGKLYNNLTESFTSTVKAVVLRVSKGRVMWAATFGQDAEPLCASDDAKMPRVADGYQAGPCATCPFAQWGADKTPPACSLVYTYLASNVDDEDMPFLLSAMRTSAKSAKKLNSLLKMYGLSRRVLIGTELVKGDQGQWYELRFAANGALTRDEQVRYADIMRNMAEVSMNVDTEQTAGAADLGPDDRFPNADDLTNEAQPDGLPF